jgi:hypothetical protein
MAIRNLHWYTQNEGIAYPVDEAATAVDDNGRRLPSHVLADMQLRWPLTLGRYAFLSALSVTPSLVTLTIQAADDLDIPGHVPLAVVSVPQPVEDGRVHALWPQVAGTAGWVVFGAGTRDVPYQGRFATPRQSRLAARAARPYRPLPVTSAQVAHAADRLTGVVTLRALAPLLLRKEEREIAGVLRDCIVLRLADTAGADGLPVPPEAANIPGHLREKNTFREFAGPCAGRPESGTCGQPEPVEFINAVTPDCDGTITLEFRGCAVVGKIDGPCGIVIDCGLGLADACLPPHLPDDTGRLPSEYDPIPLHPPASPPPLPPPPAESESLRHLGALPYRDCFLDGNARDFETRSGLWQMVADASPDPVCPELAASQSFSSSSSSSLPLSGHSLGSATAAMRNVIVWNGFDDSTAGRRLQADVKMVPGPTGARHNAALVLNHRPHPLDNGRDFYYQVEIDYDDQQFLVSRFNGTSFVRVAPVIVPGLVLDHWYRLAATVVPGPGPGRHTITAQLTSVTSPGSTDVSLTVEVNDYGPSNGRNGFGANRALARFSNFLVQEYP